MAPNLVGKSLSFLDDQPSSAEPVQIIHGKAPGKPFLRTTSAVKHETTTKSQQDQQQEKKYKYKREIVWKNVLLFIYIHVSALMGLYYGLVHSQRTFWWGIGYGILAGQGITSGAHRLWAHKTYKAKVPLRILLAFFQTVALQNDIYEWCRDHRVHHKFTETDADPHNAKRGFFFSHMGWLLVKKHRDVITRGKSVDMSDLEQDPVVMFQRKYYWILGPLCSIVIPVLVPWYFWNEHIYYSFITAGMCRYVISLHCTWLVNSAAHMFGTKPYDKNIMAVESKTVSIFAFGEGWHNYHHVFPWDYKAAELGQYGTNFSTAFIDFFARIGWAYDLKTASVDMIKRRVARTGDGSWQFKHLINEKGESIADHHHSLDGKDNIWGWDDKDMDQNERNIVEIQNRVPAEAPVK